MKNFRGLHDELLEYQGVNLYEDVLLPFIPDGLKCMEPLTKFARLKDSKPDSLNEEDLWHLFALGVCNDFLLMPLQVSLKEYITFFESLGFTLIEKQESFNPLLHEIVEVGNWKNKDEGIILGNCYWPGLRYGELIFSRSALDVFCHEKWGIIEGIANKTTLYFTNRRVRRKVHDLSHGWGANSRWRTDFSRNYITKDYSFINIDSKHDLYVKPPDEKLNEKIDKELYDLTIAQARELLINKCFVGHSPKPNDFFPYNWHMTVRNSENNWPLKPENVVSTKDALEKICIDF